MSTSLTKAVTACFSRILHDNLTRYHVAMSTLPPIGLIGLGIMGRPMAGHLLKAGYPLSVFTRTKSRAESVLAAGAVWCDSPAAVAARCEILITIVTDTPDVQAVLFGDADLGRDTSAARNSAAAREAAAAALKPGSIVVDMSTIDPTATRRFAAQLAERKIAMLDAPVTGGEIGAINATLTIMAGGDAAAFARVRPLFEKLGKKIAHVGPSGAGQSLKACNQILCAVNMIAVCEALELVRAAGLDPAQAIDTLAAGSGGSWAWSTLGAKIVAGDLNPAFMIKLIQKDLRIAQSAADAAKLPLPGTALAQQLFRAVEASPGGGNLGTQAMILAYRRMMKAEG
ncbi:MAG: 2-hydroxy-3-oxopropionate reductase [Planctomycetota bacterium]